MNRFSLLSVFAGFGCTSDAALKVNNSSPTAEITVPSDGDTVREGRVVTATGLVVDGDHAATYLLASWHIGDEQIRESAELAADGVTSCEFTVPSDSSFELRLEGRDPKGEFGNDTVNLTVIETEAPEVSLSAPVDGARFYLGEAIAFEATITDAEDGPESIKLWFESSLEGRIDVDTVLDSAGLVAGILELGLGVHDLALWAEDSDGKQSFARVVLSVEEEPDFPPTAEILHPLDGTSETFFADELIALNGLGLDDEDDNNTLVAAWSSSIDGELGVAATVSIDGAIESYGNLTEGEHVLTLSVTDSAGQVTEDSVVVEVGPPNMAPLCTINAPISGDVGAMGEMVLLEGSATDGESPSELLIAQWSSDKDGDLGAPVSPDSTGMLSLGTDYLSADTHTLSLTVEDEFGLFCVDSVVFNVSARPEISVSAPLADTTVHEAEAVTFVSAVSDLEDLGEELNVVWTSTIDDVLFDGPADSTGASTFVTAALSAGVHTMTAQVTDSDGLTASVTQNLTVNARPSAPTVSISPASPQTGDDLVVTISTPSIDPEGSALSYEYAWTQDGIDAAWTGALLPSARTAKGEVWRVFVAASDGSVTGDSGLTEVTIQNTAPTLISAAISPESPVVGDTLTCLRDGFFDADGDTDESIVTWLVGGEVVGTGVSLSSGFKGGDAVGCTVIPHDGTDAGEVVSTSIVIGNTEPIVVSVNITSAGLPVVGADLSCEVVATDADGDEPSLTYAWSVGGSAVGGGSSLTLTALMGSHGDDIVCSVIAADSAGATATGEASVSYQNTAPSVADVTISPDEPDVSSTLECGYTFSDVDEDPDISTIEWLAGGMVIGTGETLSSGFSGGDSVVCRVTPNDGVTDGASRAAVKAIRNSPPIVSGVSISPSEAYAGDNTFVCDYTFTDADGDTDESSIQWLVNDILRASGDTFTATFFTDDHVSCTVIPDDGIGGGASVSTSITIGNHTPAVSGVYLSPDPASGDDELTCNYTFSDADGDPDESTVVWKVNGLTVTGGGGMGLGGVGIFYTGTTLSSGFTGGDIVGCIVTPDDGVDQGLPVSASTIIYEYGVPVVVDVAISPADPIADDLLTCGYTFVDFTDSADLSTIAWSVDGIEVGSGVSIEAAELGGETVTCTVTPDNGTEMGEPSSASVEVGGLFTGTMVLIEPSPFLYTGPGYGLVTLSNDFWLSETEITQGQFVAMMGFNPTPASTLGLAYGDNYPVEGISWHMAAAFSNAVSSSEGLESCYSCEGTGLTVECAVAVDGYLCDGYRLPSDYEWHFGGLCGDDFVYAGSDDYDEVAWFSGNSGGLPQLVGQKLPNSCGLYDMSGSVQEWTDGRGSGPFSEDRTDPMSGVDEYGQLSGRGGDWANGEVSAISIFTMAFNPSSSGSWRFTGMRLARTNLP